MSKKIEGILPPGQYFIGDLCYVLGDKWDEVCDKIIDGDKVKEGLFCLNDGTSFVSLSTKYGDGLYPSNQIDQLFSVDSGGIGAVLLGGLPEGSEEKIKQGALGHIVNFEYHFPFSRDDGTLTFGHITINTSEIPEEEDEYFEYYDDDDFDYDYDHGRDGI